MKNKESKIHMICEHKNIILEIKSLEIFQYVRNDCPSILPLKIY